MKTLTLLILILATLIPRSIGHSQVNNGGTAVNVGTIPASVNSISQLPVSAPNGTTIYNYGDSSYHYYTGTGWCKGMDSISVSKLPRVTSIQSSSADLNITGTNPITSSGIDTFTIKPAYKIQRFGTHASTTLPMKYWDTIIVAPSTAQGDSINFSYVGFTTLPTITCNAQLNTTTAGACVQTSIKSWSSTGCSVSLVNGNSSVVTLLSTVLSLGAATNYATTNLSLITINITAQGY